MIMLQTSAVEGMRTTDVFQEQVLSVCLLNFRVYMILTQRAYTDYHHTTATATRCLLPL